MPYKVKQSNGETRTVNKRPNYQVLWEWRDPEVFGITYQTFADLVDATNAERAISKVRKLIFDEYDVPGKSSIVILEVKKI